MFARCVQMLHHMIELGLLWLIIHYAGNTFRRSNASGAYNYYLRSIIPLLLMTTSIN